MKKVNPIIFLSAVLMILTSSVCNAADKDNIDNGGFENGIDEFGICYSSREDTVMPAIYQTKEMSSVGESAAELLPGKSLGSEESISPVSNGIAYQGLYNKKTFSAKSGKKYTISADIYPKKKDVKMKFFVFDNGKLTESSEEFSVNADRWNQAAFAFTPSKDLDNVRIRIGFYDIDEGKSIFIDEFSCKESVIGTSMWKPQTNESIGIDGNEMSFTVKNGALNGIYCESDTSSYKTGNYALTGTVSTDADKAYLILNCPSVSGAHSEYVLKNGEEVNAVLAFEPQKSADGKIRTEISVMADRDAKVTLKNVEIVDVNYLVNVSENDNKITVSGQLKRGNENRQISVDISDMGVFNTTTDSAGRYTFTHEIPNFANIRRLAKIKVSDINGYNEVNNMLCRDFYITNTEKMNETAQRVNECKTEDEVSKVLTADVLDEMGISAIPVVMSADINKILSYLASNDISDGRQLTDTIKTAACFDALDKKAVKLSEVIDEYADILNVKSIAAYNDIYAKADKESLNTMFEQSSARIKDFDTFEYAITEIAVRYEVNGKVSSAQQMAVFRKYADGLNLNFDKYSKLSSDKQYSVSNSLMSGIKNVTDYSSLQAKLDRLVADAASSVKSSGSSGGTGDSGSGRKDGFNSYDVPFNNGTSGNDTKEFRFSDIDSVKWAEEGIYALVKKGVIAQPEDNRYNPQNNITRAEFAKMVSVLFGIGEHTQALALTDVNENDWYYPYVAALYEKGIVSGISETEFGSGAEITRQDICVILANILKPEEGAYESFTDIDDVSEYAVSAVGAMKKRGVISGYEDGSFRPKGYATRAEVAKILYEISK